MMNDAVAARAATVRTGFHVVQLLWKKDDDNNNRLKARFY
jgi:hypothetical protein